MLGGLFMNNFFTIVLIILYAYGFYSGWNQLTHRTGLICSHITQKTTNWINQKKFGPIVVKILISFIFAYVFCVITILKLILALFKLCFRV